MWALGPLVRGIAPSNDLYLMAFPVPYRRFSFVALQKVVLRVAALPDLQLADCRGSQTGVCNEGGFKTEDTTVLQNPPGPPFRTGYDPAKCG